MPNTPEQYQKALQSLLWPKKVSISGVNFDRIKEDPPYFPEDEENLIQLSRARRWLERGGYGTLVDLELREPDEGLSQKEAAERMCCSTATVRRYLKSGKLREFGNYIRKRVSSSSVREFLNKKNP